MECVVKLFRDPTVEERIFLEHPPEDPEPGIYVIEPTSGILHCENLVPTTSKQKSHTQKEHACYFCGKSMTKIYRHYTTVHKNKQEVITIKSASTNKGQKRQLMDQLRKQGDYKFNSNIHIDNEPIVCRISQKTGTSYVTCPGCKGSYSKFNIRHHLKKCVPPKHVQKRRNVQGEVNTYDRHFHKLASEDLRIRVFSKMRDGVIKNILRYDEAIILFGNYQCLQYPEERNGLLIRSHLRILGKLVLAAQTIDPTIENMLNLLDISRGNIIVKSIDQIARIKTNNTYEAPSTAKSLTTLLKQMCRVLETEFMQSNDEQNERKMKKMGKFLEMRFRVTVNKKSNTTQKIANRRKKIKLPKTETIAQFPLYLQDKVKYFTEALKQKFSKQRWTALAQYMLVNLTVFNRKRPRECQRIEVEDFEHYEIIEEDELPQGSEINNEQIKKYARICFTGKLGRNNALLIDRDFGLEAIKLILKYREQAGVPGENKYLFGKPSTTSLQETFETCSLIRKFAEESGIDNNNLLRTRTRLLRQHIATETASSKVDERIENRLSDFMSHQRQIHKDYYVMTQKQDDIAKVSTLLENVSSINNNEQESANKNLENVPLKDKGCPKSNSNVPDENHFGIVSKQCEINKQTKRHLETTSIGPSAAKKKKPNFEDSDYENASDNSVSSDSSEISVKVNSKKKISRKKLDTVLGKKQTRNSWSSNEKEVACQNFHDEIYEGKIIEMSKVKKKSIKLYIRIVPLTLFANGSNMNFKKI